MSTNFTRRPVFARFGLLALAVLSAQVGCQGPPGPAGPPGPPGSSSGGAPYVWVCTPANYFSGGNTQADIFIFNGSAATANVAVHLLNKDVRVVSDQPVAVGSNIQFSGFHPVPCSLLPK